MVTIKQIAELCGVSRGTVDRVLNGRGKVRPEKAALVRAMAEKLNYRPNPAGKALSARKKQPVVGVLIASEGVHFFDEVLDAMHHRAALYQHLRTQGHCAMQIVFDQLVNGIAPEHEKYIMHNEIRILENVTECDD